MQCFVNEHMESARPRAACSPCEPIRLAAETARGRAVSMSQITLEMFRLKLW